MKRAIVVFVMAFAVLIGWLMVLLRDATDLEVDNPRFELAQVEMDDHLLPSIVRYQSRLEDLEEPTSFGLVLDADDGVPIRVLNLSALHPEVGCEPRLLLAVLPRRADKR